MSTKLPIAIEHTLQELSEDQLILLSQKVNERLKLINRIESLKEISKYNIGETVSFEHNGQIKTGTITKLNQKSVSLVTDENAKWTVHPSFLSKVIQGSINKLKIIQYPSVGRNEPCPCGSGKKYKHCCA